MELWRIITKKRSTKCISEALAYAKSIEERFHRKPRLDEFWEEFPLFVDKENMHFVPHLPYKRQLRDSFDIGLNIIREFMMVLKNS